MSPTAASSLNAYATTTTGWRGPWPPLPLGFARAWERPPRRLGGCEGNRVHDALLRRRWCCRVRRRGIGQLRPSRALQRRQRPPQALLVVPITAPNYYRLPSPAVPPPFAADYAGEESICPRSWLVVPALQRGRRPRAPLLTAPPPGAPRLCRRRERRSLGLCSMCTGVRRCSEVLVLGTQTPSHTCTPTTG